MSADILLSPVRASDRELLISELFVVLTRAKDGAAEILELLALGCVNLLGVAAAGVMLQAPRGGLEVMAASARARPVEEFQAWTGEGPSGQLPHRPARDRARAGGGDPLAPVRGRGRRCRLPFEHGPADAMAG